MRCHAILSALVVCCTVSGSACLAAEDLFTGQIEPLLERACYECHGPESDEGQGGLRLDSLAGMLRGGQLGPAIVPGEPDRSLLMHAITHEPTVEPMPPDARLRANEIAAVRRWIQLGAHWPGSDVAAAELTGAAVLEAAERKWSDQQRSFWAFLPPRRPAIPAIQDSSWVRNAVDAFILSGLAAAALRPALPADRRTLIRRATLDLHGLPPTPREVAMFLADTEPGAWERLVDRLLASPRYGERWGRHWLDVARYSDSNGMDDNIAYADAWRYRDYVIDAWNGDKPYDRFVAEQLAGDLLADWNDPRRAESVIATTFLMLGPKMPSADDPVKQQLDLVDEQLDAVFRAFLGLTLSCARCHDHKFDPLSMRDYYAVAGIFHSTRSMLKYRVDAKFNLTALAGRAQNTRLDRIERELDGHDDALVNGNKVDMSVEQRARHTRAKAEALRRMSEIPTAMAVEEGRIEDMRLLLRGNHLTPAGLVPRAVPRILSRHRSDSPGKTESGRRELAAWLIRPTHPLLSRVMVNRVWQWHFGEGIVRSVDNFGHLGERPDNQPLLDWLAVRFVESGWSLKTLQRLIMTSSSYRMAVSSERRSAELDPDNRLLSRMNRRRLEAEAIRDSLLSVARLLDLSMGGKLLPIPNHKIMSGDEIRRCNALHKLPRRTVYLPVIRSGLHEFLTTFDFPDPSSLTGRRNTTTVAPQALYMMNSDLVRGVARQLARQLSNTVPDRTARITRAYETILLRPPRADELRDWLDFLARHEPAEPESRTNAEPAAASLAVWESVCRVLCSSNEFVYRN